MSDVTDDDLTRWERLCEAATEGPWIFASRTDRSVECTRDECGVCRVIVWGRNWDAESCDPGSVSGIADLDDGEFIAESRTALPLLIAEVRRLRAANQLPAAESIRIISQPK